MYKVLSFLLSFYLLLLWTTLAILNAILYYITGNGLWWKKSKEHCRERCNISIRFSIISRQTLLDRLENMVRRRVFKENFLVKRTSIFNHYKGESDTLVYMSLSVKKINNDD